MITALHHAGVELMWEPESGQSRNSAGHGDERNGWNGLEGSGNVCNCVIWRDGMGWDVIWCNVLQYGVVWCGVMWCEVMKCDVKLCDNIKSKINSATIIKIFYFFVPKLSFSFPVLRDGIFVHGHSYAAVKPSDGAGRQEEHEQHRCTLPKQRHRFQSSHSSSSRHSVRDRVGVRVRVGK